MEKSEQTYIRVGTTYFKVTYDYHKRFGTKIKYLEKWNRQELMQDEGLRYMKDNIPKYDRFTLQPDHHNYKLEHGNNYNIYHELTYKPEKPPPDKPYKGIYWTHVLMREVFGNQYKLGFQYLKVLYDEPTQILPVLVLVSKVRETGKSTFLNLLNAIFGQNMAMINPESIGSTFNGDYAGANIIGIDETIIERKSAVEKIKALATAKHITLHMKFVEPRKIDFYGKIVMATNNESDFMRIEQEEIRFWIRKLNKPRIKNHNIEKDLIKEIPYLLYYLKNMPEIDYSHDRMVFTPDQLRNEYLDQVKEASRSGLYKELNELIVDWFSNNNEYELKVIPKDIKEKWFHYNNQISINYIRKVLKDDFGLVASEPQSYKPFEESIDWKTGRVFTLTRDMFIEDNEEGGVPF